MTDAGAFYHLSASPGTTVNKQLLPQHQRLAGAVLRRGRPLRLGGEQRLREHRHLGLHAGVGEQQHRQPDADQQLDREQREQRQERHPGQHQQRDGRRDRRQLAHRRPRRHGNQGAVAPSSRPRRSRCAVSRRTGASTSPARPQTNGALATLWDCHGGANQQLFQPSTAAGELRLYNGGKCLDVVGRGTANGTAVKLWDCNGGTNQQFASTATAASPACRCQQVPRRERVRHRQRHQDPDLGLPRRHQPAVDQGRRVSTDHS